MGRRCVLGCGNFRNLFPFPPNSWLRKKWLEFIHFEEGGLCASSRICDRHFSDDCFTNLAMHTAGMASYLSLSENAVPSVYTVGASPPVKPATRDVGCQCEMAKRSACVQVKRPAPYRRNKAIQVHPLTKTASSCTSELCSGGLDVRLLTLTTLKRPKTEAADDDTVSAVTAGATNTPAIQPQDASEERRGDDVCL